MSEATRKRIVYVASGAAIVWAVANIGIDKDTPVETPLPARAADASRVLPSADKLVINIKEKQKQKWGNNPFRRRTSATQKPTKPNKITWKLSGILYNSSSPVAYINRKAVRIGEIVDNARVVSINRKSVTLELDGNRFTLHVTRG